MLLHRWTGVVGVLTWAVLLGALATNLGVLPTAARPGLQLAASRLLRVGVVLLGLSLPLGEVVGLGLPVVALVCGTVLATLLLTLWWGRLLAVGRSRSLLIATGFAVCGAAAVAAVADEAEADEDDVATAIAMVTIWGTLALVAVPLLQVPLGLDDAQLGSWAGASVHEVGQVVAAAGPAGAAAVSVAVVVKLTRVLLLAPLVAGIRVARRRRARIDALTGAAPGSATARAGTPPPVPLFVLGFVGCVLLRSTGLLPQPALEVAAEVQVLLLAAALVGLGAAVHLPSLLRTGGRPLVLGGAATVLVAVVSLAWVVRLV